MARVFRCSPLLSIRCANQRVPERGQAAENLSFSGLRQQMLRLLLTPIEPLFLTLWSNSAHNVHKLVFAKGPERFGGSPIAPAFVSARVTKERTPSKVGRKPTAWHVRCCKCFAAEQARRTRIMRDNEVNMTRRPIQQVLPSTMIAAMICLAAALWAATPAQGQSTGKHDFEKLCAPCHGDDGTGKGRDLTEANPPDLTDISSRNGGRFPFDKVYRIVDGREMMDSHKRFAMPFWGVYLQKQGIHESEAAVKQRISEIVRYVETMQKK
jgi:mono/diheme cytochrome c family protein